MHLSTKSTLEGDLKVVSIKFCRLADELAYVLPEDPETTACLRKLLDVKDCAVRAAIADGDAP